MVPIKSTPYFLALCARFRPKKAESPKDEALRALILEAQKDIATNRAGLQFADSDDLTDMYIYAIKAAEIRYEHLLRMVKNTEAV